MTFQPFLNQLIPHPTHHFLLPNPLALAAFGEPDHKIRKHRPNLVEGTHFIYLPDEQRRQRLYYTIAGLLDLATRLDTERSLAFRAELIRQFSNLTSGKLAVREPLNIQPAEVLPTEIIPSRIEQPGLSSNLVHNPQIAELLQLKREELQIQRNAQELERLKLLRDALQQERGQAARQQHPNTSTTADEENGEQYMVNGQKLPIQINIQNNLEGSGYAETDTQWMQSFAVWLFGLVVILLIPLVCTAGIVSISNQMERSGHVR